MRINITFRQMEGTDAIKDYVSRKVGRVRKYLQGPAEASVVMSVERHLQGCDVTITASGKTYKATESTEDMYTSVDKVMDKIERQISRMKGRVRARKGPGASSAREAVAKVGKGRLGVGAVPEAGEEDEIEVFTTQVGAEQGGEEGPGAR